LEVRVVASFAMEAVPPLRNRPKREIVRRLPVLNTGQPTRNPWPKMMTTCRSRRGLYERITEDATNE
jgi:hypothetical protein